MNILITGASGFVGINIRQYLASNGISSIYLLSREELNGPESILTDIFANQQVNAVIHLAAKVHDLHKVVSEEEYLYVNLGLTQKLFKIFLQSKAHIFIFMSSVKAVADTLNGTTLTEKYIPIPSTIYGKSKLAAETYLLNHQLSDDKRLYILRPCMIHGPENKGNLNLLYKVVKKGVPYPLAAFSNKRSYLSVENLCFVFHQLLVREDIASGIYNVADDEPVSTNDVVQIIANSLGKSGRLWKISPVLVKWIASVGDIIPLPLNSERLQKLTNSYVVSNHKLITALQVQLPLNSKAGLKKTIESFKDAL